MTMFIDTNVLLDELMERHPYFKPARAIFAACEKGGADGCISALSIPNIMYILRRDITRDRIQYIVEMLSGVFRVVGLTETDIKRAAKLGLNDFEDALQYCTAARAKCDCIVTRNAKDFPTDGIDILSPAAALERFQLIG
ncbi:DNA-binding protein [Clostridia bacterium]|nr:DNA-binding protein [Clostridia bacterium]